MLQFIDLKNNISYSHRKIINIVIIRNDLIHSWLFSSYDDRFDIPTSVSRRDITFIFFCHFLCFTLFKIDIIKMRDINSLEFYKRGVVMFMKIITTKNNKEEFKYEQR